MIRITFQIGSSARILVFRDREALLAAVSTGKTHERDLTDGEVSLLRILEKRLRDTTPSGEDVDIVANPAVFQINPR